MSLSVGVTLKQLQKRIEIYNDAAVSPEPYAGVVNKRFSVYALANCADTNEQARADARAPMLAYLKGVVDLYENTMKSAAQVSTSRKRDARFQTSIISTAATTSLSAIPRQSSERSSVISPWE